MRAVVPLVMAEFDFRGRRYLGEEEKNEARTDTVARGDPVPDAVQSPLGKRREIRGLGVPATARLHLLSLSLTPASAAPPQSASIPEPSINAESASLTAEDVSRT